MFSGTYNVSSVEHVSRYLAGEASGLEQLMVRLFPLSLFGSTFAWFASLPPNSVNWWADLEKKFHKYFYIGINELKLTDLTSVRQRT
jgi:hypothetical protein